VSHPMSLLHFPIHFQLFPFISIVHFHSPLFILLLHTFSGLRLLCPCLQTPLCASASVHLMCLSSRPFQTHPMCYCFTVLAVHLSYVSHAGLCPLSHVVCFHTPDLCGLLLAHVFASILFYFILFNPVYTAKARPMLQFNLVHTEISELF